MDRAQFMKKVKQINIWRKYDQRAPHKPLLILYALGKLHTFKQATLPFSEVEVDLKALLNEFGCNRQVETNLNGYQ
ncbi:hypothetical protein LF822_08760 [Halobacillus sp. A5]|nr:hypothetical protein [Halobacillus sp. A5]MCP3027026.1 hypothetical protein [Halobacillus sp. A5]